MLPYNKVKAIQGEINARNSRAYASQRKVDLIGFGKKSIAKVAALFRNARESQAKKVRPAI